MYVCGGEAHGLFLKLTQDQRLPEEPEHEVPKKWPGFGIQAVVFIFT